MTGTRPVADVVPLEYRRGLEAALSIVAWAEAILVRCEVADLRVEIEQLVGTSATARPAAALWVEPQVGTWWAELASIVEVLPIGAPLIVIASRPLARFLPERRAWHDQPLGLQIGGIWCLRRGIAGAGFRVEAVHGFHSGVAAALSFAGSILERSGRPDLGDRLRFVARSHYCSTSAVSRLCTVTLIVARRERR